LVVHNTCPLGRTSRFSIDTSRLQANSLASKR
jgi:hypothetical protein